MNLEPGSISCAKSYKAGWWFRSCHETCLNCDYIGSGAGGPAYERYMAIRKMAEEESEG